MEARAALEPDAREEDQRPEDGVIRVVQGETLHRRLDDLVSEAELDRVVRVHPPVLTLRAVRDLADR